MCPVLLPVSMVPLDDNLAGETAIFNRTLIYCAAPLLAWLWLKEWVGCCVAFCSLFCWGVWLTLIACSYSRLYRDLWWHWSLPGGKVPAFCKRPKHIWGQPHCNLKPSQLYSYSRYVLRFAYLYKITLGLCTIYKSAKFGVCEWKHSQVIFIKNPLAHFSRIIQPEDWHFQPQLFCTQCV